AQSAHAVVALAAIEARARRTPTGAPLRSDNAGLRSVAITARRSGLAGVGAGRAGIPLAGGPIGARGVAPRRAALRIGHAGALGAVVEALGGAGGAGAGAALTHLSDGVAHV